jgi:hypothetical protein
MLDPPDHFVLCFGDKNCITGARDAPVVQQVPAAEYDIKYKLAP